MSTIKHFVAAASCCLIVAGCSSFEPKSARDLSQAEMAVLEKTHQRLKENKGNVRGSLNDLADTVSFALRQQHNLSSNIAKAQLLESMKSPWSGTKLSETQREVALYHLFALAEAERAVLAARERERHASIAKVKGAYNDLVASMAALVSAQGQILAQLGQPGSARHIQLLDRLLVESKAFRNALDADDPKLQRLAEAVAEKEDTAANVREKLVKILELTE